jgi:hypothetical protein
MIQNILCKDGTYTMNPISKIIYCIIFLLFLCNCSNTDEKTSAIHWFNNHKTQIIELKNELLQHPNVHWINPSLTLKEMYKEGELTAEDCLFYEHTVKKMNELDIRIVSVFREKNKMDGDLLSVSFKIKDVGGGILKSKYAVSIQYILNDKVINTFKPNEIYPLNEKEWFVTIS